MQFRIFAAQRFNQIFSNRESEPERWPRSGLLCAESGQGTAAPFLIARPVYLGRQCCAFLTFRIMVGSGRQPICLEITGPPDAKAIIADLFGS